MMTQARKNEKENKSSGQQNKVPSTKRQGQKPGRPQRIHEHAGPRPKTHSLLQLQRTHGNQAVQQLVNERIQPKLKVGQPDDKYEREADRVARTIIRTPGTNTASNELPIMAPLETSQMKRGISSRTRQTPNNRKTTTTAFQSVISLLGKGIPLPDSERIFFESRFGRSFEDVRIHRGANAEIAAQAFNARAFTHGTDIVFDRGQYRPATERGRQLLAHELTHTIQQDELRTSSVVQADFWDTVKRGAKLYWNLSDEGAPFARQLMEHYLFGLGTDFDVDPGDPGWNHFMLNRPEIQRAMAPTLEKIAARVASGGPTAESWFPWSGPEIKETVTGVTLNELESMRLTLHGSHRIEVTVNYDVNAISGGHEVIFRRIWMKWVDKGDMHPGTQTELETGEMVDDAELIAAGSPYNIYIEFSPFERTIYHVRGGSVTKVSGWPPVPGTAVPGRRD